VSAYFDLGRMMSRWRWMQWGWGWGCVQPPIQPIRLVAGVVGLLDRVD